ncbi:hypothetical protein AS188_15850 (plasmid) [Kocuria flava]|uniref:Uncharacterized protein n=1 Tax=Kocuria flava TaxID=446860 RepID=A0A0U2WYP5_9MICC|nr:hypothetical protein AS188_15850 [Kocuria flava]
MYTLNLVGGRESDLAEFIGAPAAVVDGGLERLGVVLLGFFEGLAGVVEGAAGGDGTADVVHPVVEQPLRGFFCLLGVSELRHAFTLTDAHCAFQSPRALRYRFTPVLPRRSKAIFYVP